MKHGCSEDETLSTSSHGA